MGGLLNDVSGYSAKTKAFEERPENKKAREEARKAGTGNERLGLSQQQLDEYRTYRKGEHGAFGHIQTVDEWAKARQYGVFAKDGGAGPAPGAPGSSVGPAPDLTDEALREVRRNMLLRAKMGRGRASSFLTGPAGSAAETPTRRRRFGPMERPQPTLLGG